MSINFKQLSNLKINIFLDGADLDFVHEVHNDPVIKGFTSNPSLMHNSGISSYEEFIKKFLSITKKPISFEVVADELEEMYKQAEKLSSYGSNIHVKIPVTNTKGESTVELIKNLTNNKVKLNITAIFTIDQLKEIINKVDPGEEIILSIFAGRIADTGLDPSDVFLKAREIIKQSGKKKFRLLWASVREVFNIYQADRIGCDIITVTFDILKKTLLRHKDLNEYSIETIKMFYDDAKKGNLKI